MKLHSTILASLVALLSIPVPRVSAAAGLKWTKNTVVVDANTAQGALVSVSTDGHVLVFNSTDPRILSFAAGQVVVLEDLGARKVLGVLHQAPLTAIATNSAGLTDFIQDGTIQFPNASKDPLIRNQQDTDEYGLKGEMNNWDFDVHSELENNDLEFSFDAKKTLSGLTATVKGSGKLTESGFSFLADIQGGKLQRLVYTAPSTGNLKVSWAAMTSGANRGIGESRLIMPALFKEIFEVHHLPFLYQIGANLIFTPGLGSKKDALSGGFEVQFKGSGGFSADSSQSAAVREMEAAPPSIDKTLSASLAASGVVVAVNAPKLSFSFGTESFMEAVHQVVPDALKNKKTADAFEARLAGYLTKDQPGYFKTDGGAYVQWVAEFDYAGSGPMSVVPCTTTHFNLQASGGVDAKLLGMNSDAKFDLYSKKWTSTEPDVKACRID